MPVYKTMKVFRCALALVTYDEILTKVSQRADFCQKFYFFPPVILLETYLMFHLFLVLS